MDNHGPVLPTADVVIAGSGPAALALAAACGGQHLRTVLVAPDPDARWVPTYGVWADQLERAGLAEPATGAGTTAATVRPVVAQSWPSVLVGTDAHGLSSVGRAYARLDNDGLAARLHTVAAEHDVAVVADVARGAASDADGVVVGLASGRTIAARLVVDATGYPGALVARRRTPVPAWQVAYGIVARFAEPPVPPGSCVFMDWRPGRDSDDVAPTFLYAMDLADGTFLVEETVLAARRPPEPDALAARLRQRLDRWGTPPTEVLSHEIVRIPMGAVAPPVQQVVPFGAAAGMIHPATGYSVGSALAAAPGVASAIRQAIDRRATPHDLSLAAWRAVWPSGRRRARALEQYGLGSMLTMDRRQLDAFFATFFALPVDVWLPYLDGGSLGGTARLMRAMFAAVPPAVRRRLMAGDVRALPGLVG